MEPFPLQLSIRRFIKFLATMIYFEIPRYPLLTYPIALLLAVLRRVQFNINFLLITTT